MKVLSLVALLLLVGGNSIFATTITFGEQIFAGQAAFFCSLYAGEHPGQIPTSWDDLEREPGSLDRQYPRVLPTKRYAFLEHPFPLPGVYENCDPVIIARQPMRVRTADGIFSYSFRPPGRFIIFHRRGSDDFQSQWFEENRIQEAVKRAGIALPAPDHEPSRMHPIAAVLAPFVWPIFWIGVFFTLRSLAPPRRPAKST